MCLRLVTMFAAGAAVLFSWLITSPLHHSFKHVIINLDESKLQPIGNLQLHLPPGTSECKHMIGHVIVFGELARTSSSHTELQSFLMYFHTVIKA